ncbi:MAG: hypothetical protein GY787_13000 [Alteromonadales bacterium]|nr:hypothetical protein [Alteromonadales bacterium]
MNKIIYRIPRYTDEARALGVRMMSVGQAAHILLGKIHAGEIKEPVHIDATYRGAILCDYLRAEGVNVVKERVRVLDL